MTIDKKILDSCRITSWREKIMRKFPTVDDLITESARVMEYRETYSWAIPNMEALRAIAKFAAVGGIVEIGCGKGLWGKLLLDMGAEWVGYDLNVPEEGWTTVLYGGVEKAIGHESGMTLMLCWPPYKKPFAYNALRSYDGKQVVYIGEGKGGCTGDDRFHVYLDKHYIEVERIVIDQWPDMNDRVYLYQRRFI